MKIYIFKRFIYSLTTLLISTAVIFFILNLAPGSIAEAVLGAEATPEAIQIFKERYGLNDPLYIQYSRWLGGILTRGYFGESVIAGQSVNDLIVTALPVTLEIVFIALLFEIAFAFFIGAISAFNKDNIYDHLLRIFAVIFVSIPDFWLGIIFIVYIIIQIRLFPSFVYVHWSLGLYRHLISILPPALVLSLRQGGIVGRMTRSEILDIGSQDFVRTLRAIGAPKWTIRKKIFRNSLIPSVTLIGMSIGFLISASVIVEIVFLIPGIGMILYNSILMLDVPTTQAILLILTSVFVFGSFIVDILYSFLNPKIRYEKV